MSLFTKLFKGISGTAGNLAESKSTRKAAAEASTKAATEIKDFASGGLKTTSAIGSQGAIKATAGGVNKVVKSFTKGTDNTAKIGNKLVKAGGYTAVAAIPALGAVGLGSMGLGLYNDYKTSKSLTDEDRRDRQVGEDYINYLRGLSDLGINVRDTSGNPNVDQNPTSMGNTGVGGSSYFDPYAQKDTTDSDSGSGLGFMGIAGIALLGGGAYYLIKKNKKSASKSTA